MKQNKIDRRLFIKSSALAATGLIAGNNAFSAIPSVSKNKLPRWKGFNLLDYFSPGNPAKNNHDRTTEDDLKWMADWGFNFVRIPMAYPSYLDFDRSRK